MTQNNETQIFDSKKYSSEVSEIISQITSSKLSKEELKEAKKTLANIQKLASEAIEKFNTILPDLTDSEKRIVNAQKFAIADSVINQIFDNSTDKLNEVEQEQFVKLITKVLKFSAKREQNKIFKFSNDLKETLYLHNDNARREKLKK